MTVLTAVQTNMLRTFCLVVSGDEKHRKMSLFMKGNSKNWTFPKIVFLTTSNLHQKAWGRSFLIIVIIHIANVPDLC
jgi:hypothetical protein